MTDSPEPAAAPPAAAEPPAQGAKEDKGHGAETFFGAMVWVIVGGIFALVNDTSRNFIFRWWWAFALVAGAALIAILMPIGQRWLSRSTATTRAAIFIFVILPALLILVGSVAVLPQSYQLTALRVAFLVVVCLLPGMMWYLFLVTRKASLLNEFLANLDRLGLLQAAAGEDEASRKRRVKSYLQKFEAIYGDLPDPIHDDVLQDRFSHYSKADASGATTLSTTAVPVMLSTVLIALGWLATLPPGDVIVLPGVDGSWVRAFEPKGAPVTLAFLGAYFFSLQMLFRRYVLKDLRGSAYVAVSVRIILAVIGIWILMAVGDEISLSHEQLLVAGFVFGVFPRVIWQVVESVFKKVGGLVVPSMISQLPVSDLDGLTVWHEARLEEEDIENIPNMATADLVELLLNTRLPPERIIDWTDQAILYTQLGPQGKGEGDARQKLRAHGIRTATSLLRVSRQLQKDREAFDGILADKQGGSAMPSLEAALATNSNLKLIQRWRDHADVPPCPDAIGASPEVRTRQELAA